MRTYTATVTFDGRFGTARGEVESTKTITARGPMDAFCRAFGFRPKCDRRIELGARYLRSGDNARLHCLTETR